MTDEKEMPPRKELTPDEKARLEHFKERVLFAKRIGERLAGIKHKILVASGKGGVGKTTAAVNLALAFARAGDAVALLDADIHAPAVPRMLGLGGARISGKEGGIKPVTAGERLVVMSMAFLLQEDADAVIWRGPLKMAMIDNFLADVEWGERDWLIVDTPPGTGDEILSLAQRIKKLDGLIMVTTPQANAVAAARKSLSFAIKMHIPVIGVVENMGSFPCPECGHKVELFGSGGGAGAAVDFGVPFLGTVPFEQETVAAADEGRPAVVSRPASPAATVWFEIAAKVRAAVTVR